MGARHMSNHRRTGLRRGMLRLRDDFCNRMLLQCAIRDQARCAEISGDRGEDTAE